MRWFNAYWPTDILYNEQAFYRYPQTLPWDFYKEEGFLSLQFRISLNAYYDDDDSKTSWRLNSTPMRAFPPYHTKDLNFERFQFLFPPIILICFYYPYWSTICSIAVEKKKESREIMKLMGISTWIYWLSLFIQKMLLHIVTVTIIVGVTKVKYDRIFCTEYIKACIRSVSGNYFVQL